MNRAARVCSEGSRKMCFGTREAAVNFATRMMLRHPNSEKPPYIRAYRCRCGWWHFTNRAPKWNRRG